MTATTPLDHFFPHHAPGLNFSSTRNPQAHATCWETLINGQAPDGGLYVPSLKDLHQVAFDSEFFETPNRAGSYSLASLSLSQISALLLRRFMPTAEISNTDLQQLMDQAHNQSVPLENLDDHTIVAWLDQFETASFKDFAARPLAQLMQTWCQKNQTPKNIVVATSGDTGVAIASAFAGSTWVSVTVLYPAGKVSSVQEAQMIDVAARHHNVQCLPVAGDFDKCQAFSKALQLIRDFPNADAQALDGLAQNLKQQLNLELPPATIKDLQQALKNLNLASANSINIWRLLPQMTQYFSSYGQALKTGRISSGQTVTFAVPTGNVGHLMAGLYARELGLPVANFVVGTNANDIVACALRDGRLQHNNLQRNAQDENEAQVTSAPSMDIADPSNLERLLELARQAADPAAQPDYSALKTATKQLEPNSQGLGLTSFGVTEKMQQYLQKNLYASSVSDAEILTKISQTQASVLLEPHGAAAAKAVDDARLDQFIDAQQIVILLETASPDKFPEAFEKAGISIKKTHPALKKLSTTHPKNPEPVVHHLATIVEKMEALATTTRAGEN